MNTDRDIIKMIIDITGKEPTINRKDDYYILGVNYKGLEEDKIKAIQEAITIKADKRLLECRKIKDKCYSYRINYKKAAPLVGDQDISVAPKYERKLKEVRALRVNEENYAKLSDFTGGGIFTKSGEKIEYSFVNTDGIVQSVLKDDYLLFDGNRYISISESEFKAEWEAK